MYLLNVNLEGWGIFVSIVAIAIGVLTWWIGKLLDDKKNSTIHEIEINNLKRRMDDIEDEMRNYRNRH